MIYQQRANSDRTGETDVTEAGERRKIGKIRMEARRAGKQGEDLRQSWRDENMFKGSWGRAGGKKREHDLALDLTERKGRDRTSGWNISGPFGQAWRWTFPSRGMGGSFCMGPTQGTAGRDTKSHSKGAFRRHGHYLWDCTGWKPVPPFDCTLV
jgi:hypothetical protein